MKPRAALAALLLTAALPVFAGPTGEPEPELRSRMAEAIATATSFDDKYLADVWLTDMSGRLARYAPKAMPDPLQRLIFLKLLHAEARQAQVSPELVLAVVEIESRFDRFAISRSGALGYMQIMPFWLEELGQQGNNLFHGETNLRMGCTILRYYLDMEHGSYVRGLARYNGSTGKPDYPYLVLDRLKRHWSR